jgi:GAF domain-containing protein
VIENVATDKRLDESIRTFYTKQFGAASTIYVPLVASGQWIGYINAIYQQPTEFPEADVRRLMLLVAQAAVVAQTIRLLEETQGLLESEQRQRRIADILVHAAERMTGVVDEQELHHIMVDEMNGLIRPDQISLYVWSDSEQAFYLEQRILAAKDHAEDDFKLQQFVIPDKNSDLWQVFQQKRPLLQTSQGNDEYLKEHYCLPWTISGQVAGVIEIYHTAKHLAIRDVDQRAAEDIVQQADLRIQNARLFTQTQLRADELSVLNEMSRDLTVSRDVDDVVENIYAYTNRLMDAQNFYVALHDRDNNVVNFPLAREQGEEITLATRPFGEGATEYVIQTGQPLLVEDGVAEWLAAHNLDATNAVAKSWLGVPLKIGDEVLGAIAIRSSRSFVYDTNQQNLLTSISSQSAIAIQNARLFNQAERRATELAILNQMGRDLTAVPDISHVLENTHAYTSQLMEARNFYVAIYDEPNQFIEFPFATEQGEQVRWRSRPFAQGMTEHVIQTGKPLLIEENVEGWLKEQGVESIGSVAQSWLGVPLLLGNEVLGVIAAQSRRARVYDHTHLNLLIAISSQAAIAIQNARLFAQTQEQLADLTTIQQATSDLTAALNMTGAIETLLPHLVQSVRADSVDIFFVDNKNMNRVGTYPLPEGDVPVVSFPLASRPLAQAVVSTKQPLTLAANDPRLDALSQQALQEMGTTVIAAVPLRSRDNVQGILVINARQPGRMFADNEIGLLQTLADQATIAFERIRLLEEAERRARREQLLREITARVRSSADVDMIMKTAVQEVGRALGRETFIHLGTEGKSRSS